MYVLINPGPKEEILQCAHTTWNQMSTIATLEVFGIPTPRTIRPGEPSSIRLADGKSATGIAVSVNTARRTIIMPRDAKEILLKSEQNAVLRRYYWDAETRSPVEDFGEPTAIVAEPAITGVSA